MAFIITYLKMKIIPKGFKLKFHNNLEFDTSNILKNCSLKLMKRTVSFYKGKVKILQTNIKANRELVNIHFADKNDEVDAMISSKTRTLNERLRQRRRNKFERDGLEMERAVQLSETKLRDIIEGKRETPASKQKELKEELLRDVQLPSHDPIVLTTNPKFQDPAFNSLCAKGPSFVPTPTTVNWTQLQLDFDNFANLIRREIYFAKNPHVTTTPKPADGPPRQPSSWRAPKSNVQDAESFLK